MPVNQFYQVDTVTLSDETLTELATYDVSEIERLVILVSNTVTAFDQFQLLGRVRASGTQATIASDAGGFSSPALPIVETNGAPVSLAAGATARITLDVRGWHEIVIKAARASGSNAVVTVNAGGN